MPGVRCSRVICANDEENRAAMDEGAAVLWPDVEDLYTLMCLRVESGRPAFEREKQNSPVKCGAVRMARELFWRGDLV